jgi:hypothetical protein
MRKLAYAQTLFNQQRRLLFGRDLQHCGLNDAKERQRPSGKTGRHGGAVIGIGVSDDAKNKSKDAEGGILTSLTA